MAKIQKQMNKQKIQKAWFGLWVVISCFKTNVIWHLRSQSFCVILGMHLTTKNCPHHISKERSLYVSKGLNFLTQDKIQKRLLDTSTLDQNFIVYVNLLYHSLDHSISTLSSWSQDGFCSQDIMSTFLCKKKVERP